MYLGANIRESVWRGITLAESQTLRLGHKQELASDVCPQGVGSLQWNGQSGLPAKFDNTSAYGPSWMEP